mgnify:CR=1 FL=1
MLDAIVAKDCLNIIKNIKLNKIKNKKILILGGNSFIANYIQVVLSQIDCKIVSVSLNKPNSIVNKIKKAKTDNLHLPSDDKGLNERPEVENLLGIYSSLNNQTLLDSINELGGKNFSEFKEKLSDLVVEKISPISDEINKLKKDNNFIDKILKEGAEKADKITSKKVNEMKKIVGF